MFRRILNSFWHWLARKFSKKVPQSAKDALSEIDFEWDREKVGRVSVAASKPSTPNIDRQTLRRKEDMVRRAGNPKTR